MFRTRWAGMGWVGVVILISSVLDSHVWFCKIECVYLSNYRMNSIFLVSTSYISRDPHCADMLCRSSKRK